MRTFLQFRGYFTSALCNQFLQVNPDSQKFLATASELFILCNGERAYMIEEEYARMCRAPGCKLAR